MPASETQLSEDRESVMRCACGCNEPVWPENFSVPVGANGTAVYYVDAQHRWRHGMLLYSKGSIDNLEGRDQAHPDDEAYMSGWFAREHSRAWGDVKTLSPTVRRKLRAALKRWNEWRAEHGFEAEDHLPI